MTQNVDNLEIKAGVHKDLLVQCHGALDGAHCAVCGDAKDPALLKQMIEDGEVMYCDSKSCEHKRHPVKHNIIFFGEKLPTEFAIA